MKTYYSKFEIISIRSKEYNGIYDCPTHSTFFSAKDDNEAMKKAREIELQGAYYSTMDHCDVRLIYLAEVEEGANTLNEDHVVYVRDEF